jgi:hypothetical protein
MARPTPSGPVSGPACTHMPVLGPGHPAPKVVLLDGTGARAGDKTNGVGVNSPDYGVCLVCRYRGEWSLAFRGRWRRGGCWRFGRG